MKILQTTRSVIAAVAFLIPLLSQALDLKLHFLGGTSTSFGLDTSGTSAGVIVLGKTFTADTNSAVYIYYGRFDNVYYKNGSGAWNTNPVVANNAIILQINSSGYLSGYQVLSSGGSTGTNGRIRDVDSDGYNIFLGGDFGSAGGYSNNSHFGIYNFLANNGSAGNGWSNYFYYPSMIDGNAVTAVSYDPATNTVSLTDSSINSATDQYGTHAGAPNNWSMQYKRWNY